MTVESIRNAFEEIVYYQGKRSGMDPILKTVKASALLTIVIYMLSRQFLQPMLDGFGEHKPRIGLYVLAAWLFYVTWTWWGWANVRYVLTNRKITFERGRFSKTIKSIDLWRVRDLVFKRSVISSFALFGGVS